MAKKKPTAKKKPAVKKKATSKKKPVAKKKPIAKKKLVAKKKPVVKKKSVAKKKPAVMTPAPAVVSTPPSLGLDDKPPVCGRPCPRCNDPDNAYCIIQLPNGPHSELHSCGVDGTAW